jgi:aminomethyltransferase
MNYPENLKPTPLLPLYGEGVVEWTDVYGFAIPVTWGDPGAEYAAIRNDVAVIEFSMLLKFDVTGPGAAECVDRVFSRNVTAMKPGRVAYGIVATEDGRMVDDCTVFYHGPDRVMVMGSNAHLGDYLAAAAGSGVTVRERRADYAQVSVQGPKSRSLLQELTSDDLSNAGFPYYAFRAEATIAGIPMQTSRLGFTGELGYELLLPVEETPRLWAALTKAGADYGLRAVGGAALMMARVEAGLIMGELEYDENSTPWECRMGWAVDLSKPAFQGREALVASKPSPRVTLACVVFPEETAGLDFAELFIGDQAVGRISIAIPSPLLGGKMLAFARVAIAHAAAGTAVMAAGVAGEIVDMPVHDPERKRTRS